MKYEYIVIPIIDRDVDVDVANADANTDQDIEYAWARLAVDGRGAWQQATVGTLAKSVGTAPLLVVAPAEDFRFVTMPVPGKNRQQLALAARYSLEDDIASDVDAVEVFVSEQSADNEYTIAIVDSTRLEQFLAPLAAAGLEISGLVPDAMLLTFEEGTVNLLIDGNRALVKYQPCQAAATNAKSLPLLLAKLSKQYEVKKFVFQFSESDPAANRAITEVQADISNPPLELISIRHSVRDFLLRSVVENKSLTEYVDLVPKKYKQQKNIVRRRRLWQLAASLFGLAVVTQLGFDWWHIHRSQAALVDTRQAQQQVVTSAFPEIGRIVNAEAQVTRSLQALEKQGPPPAEFLGVLSQSLEVPTRRELGIELLGLTFADGVLLLRTESKEMGHLEKYRAELNEFLSAEVVTAEANGDVVRGAIRISAK